MLPLKMENVDVMNLTIIAQGKGKGNDQLDPFLTKQAGMERPYKEAFYFRLTPIMPPRAPLAKQSDRTASVAASSPASKPRNPASRMITL